MIRVNEHLSIDFLPFDNIDGQFKLMHELLRDKSIESWNTTQLQEELIAEIHKAEDHVLRVGVVNKSFYTTKRAKDNDEEHKYYVRNKNAFLDEFTEHRDFWKPHKANESLEDILSSEYDFLVIPQYVSDIVKSNKILDPRKQEYAILIYNSSTISKQSQPLSESKRVDLQKNKVVKMLSNVLNTIMERKDVNNKQFKINGYKKAIRVYQDLNETKFKSPLTIDQIIQVNGIGSSIGLKIMDCLNEVSSTKLPTLSEMNTNSQNNINDKSWISEYFEKREFDDEYKQKLEMKEYFTKLYGVGELKSNEYLNGSTSQYPKSIMELIQSHPQEVHVPMLYGWKYFNDFDTKIPRDEVPHHVAIVQKICFKYDVECEALGSYIRGQKQYLGDIDFLLFKKGENDSIVLKKLLRLIIEDLITTGYIDCVLQGSKYYQKKYFHKDIDRMFSLISEKIDNKECLGRIQTNLNFLKNDGKKYHSEDSKKIFVGASLENFEHVDHKSQEVVSSGNTNSFKRKILKPEDDIFQSYDSISKSICRRVDFLIVRHTEVAVSKLYFTGSNFFNRSCRIIAKKQHGWKLTNKGLYDINNENQPIHLENCENDDEILEKLGLPQYSDPKTRELDDYIKI